MWCRIMHAVGFSGVGSPHPTTSADGPMPYYPDVVEVSAAFAALLLVLFNEIGCSVLLPMSCCKSIERWGDAAVCGAELCTLWGCLV